MWWKQSRKDDVTAIGTVESMNETAVVVGVGPGLGSALVNAFSHEGYTVLAAARRAAKVSALSGVPRVLPVD